MYRNGIDAEMYSQLIFLPYMLTCIVQGQQDLIYGAVKWCNGPGGSQPFPTVDPDIEVGKLL